MLPGMRKAWPSSFLFPYNTPCMPQHVPRRSMVLGGAHNDLSFPVRAGKPGTRRIVILPPVWTILLGLQSMPVVCPMFVGFQ